jgi:diguanylate cyclase (GGDEF)-like protein
MNPAKRPVALRHPPAPESSDGVAVLMAQRTLRAHFQPIVQLAGAEIFAHEALIRPPVQSALTTPVVLFAAAREAGLLTSLEFHCVRVAIETWGRAQPPGRLFVNLSAEALVAAMSGTRLEAGLKMLADSRVSAGTLTVELTEHDHVQDIEALRAIVELMRLHGIALALDDFGDGRSSLRLWSELKPDYVKIDKYFSRGIAENADKLQTLRAMQQLAETFGAELIAEGIETAADLRVLRDLGVRYGQGYYLGRPQAQPITEVAPEALQVLQGQRVAVMPELRLAAGRRVTAAQLLVRSRPVEADTTQDELYRLIAQSADVQAIAVVEHERPIALIDGQQFIAQYARPFFRELYGRHSCLMLANREPLLVEMDTPIDELTTVLTAQDQRYLREGFIITEGGRYRGLGTGRALVKAVTEARIEAARHANPLTFLPGNIPLSQHLDRMLGAGGAVCAAYVDLNQFKAYNDHYGYWRGDEMIRVAAGVIAAHADPQRDFVGHIGGDDFMVVFQSPDWRARCERMLQEFSTRVPGLLDADALRAGGIQAVDRQGITRLHALPSMSIGVVQAAAGAFHSAEEVSMLAAEAKRRAKQASGGCYVLEQGVGADAGSAAAGLSNTMR